MSCLAGPSPGILTVSSPHPPARGPILSIRPARILWSWPFSYPSQSTTDRESTGLVIIDSPGLGLGRLRVGYGHHLGPASDRIKLLAYKVHRPHQEDAQPVDEPSSASPATAFYTNTDPEDPVLPRQRRLSPTATEINMNHQRHRTTAHRNNPPMRLVRTATTRRRRVDGDLDRWPSINPAQGQRQRGINERKPIGNRIEHRSASNPGGHVELTDRPTTRTSLQLAQEVQETVERNTSGN